MAALVAAFGLCGAPAARAANVTWLSTGTNMNSGTAVWSAAPGATDMGFFTVAGTGTNPYLTSNMTMGGISFVQPGSSGWTLSGASNATLTLTSAGGGQTTAAISGSANSGTNTMSANLALLSTSGTSLVGTPAGSTLVLSGNVSGTTVQFFATGTLILSGSNSFTGRLRQTQSGASLHLNSMYALGGGGGVEITSANFTFNNSSGTAVSLAGNNNIFFTGGANQTLTFTGSGDLNFGSGTAVLINAGKTISPAAGVFTIGSIGVSGVNSGALTKGGAGTLAITNAAGAGFTGGVSLSLGVLQVGNDTAIGTGTLAFTNATTLQGINGDRVLANHWTAPSGNGPIFSGSQSVTMTGVGRYTGTTDSGLQSNVDAGKLLTLQGGLDLLTVTNTAATTFTVRGTGDTTISGSIYQSAGAFARNVAIINTGITTFSGSNSYTGLTTINSGATLKLDNANALPSSNPLTLAGGVLGLGTGNSSFTRASGTGAGQVQWNSGGFAAFGSDATVDIGGLGASGTVNLANGTFFSSASADKTLVWANTINMAAANKTITVNDGSAEVDARFTGPFIGNGGATTITLTKNGAGTLELTAFSNFTQKFEVTTGQVRFTGTGGMASGSLIVNGPGAELKWNSSMALSRPLTLTQGTVSGTGTISASDGVTIGSSAILSPGNSPGIQSYTTGLTWAAGGSYLWEINDWTGSAGSAYDQVAVTGGALNVTATSGSTFTINITSLTSSNASGSVPNFSNTSKTFTIATTLSGSLTNFDASRFTLNSTQFSAQNPTATGSWSISNTGSTVLLNYTPSYTATTYTLGASASASTIIVGGTSTITASVVNTGTGNNDALNYTGLAVGNGVTLGTTSGSGLAIGGTNSATGAFTTGLSGSYTFGPSVTSATNLNIGGNALLGGTTAALVTVLDHATSSLLGSGLVTGTSLNLGTWDYATSTWTAGSGTSGFAIFNLAGSGGNVLTALLALTSSTSSGDAGFTTNLGTYSQIAGGGSQAFAVSFDTTGMTTSGTYTKTFTINMADQQNLPGAAATNSLTVVANVVVVPEPETLFLAGLGVGMVAWAVWKRRRIAAICGPRT